MGETLCRLPIGAVRLGGGVSTDLDWVRCQGCGFTMFKAVIGPETIIEIRCKRCDRLNTYGEAVRLGGGGLITSDGQGGFLTVPSA